MVNHIVSECNILVKKESWLDGEGNSLGIVQEIEF